MNAKKLMRLINIFHNKWKKFNAKLVKELDY